MKRLFLATSALAFVASMSGLCLCADHFRISSHEDEHPADHHDDSHPHDDAPAPTGGCGGCGDRGDCGNAPQPIGACCCAGNQHQLAIKDAPAGAPVTPTLIGTTSSAERPISAVTSVAEVRFPPPNEGFKLWPDVPLILQHSSLLI